MSLQVTVTGEVADAVERRSREAGISAREYISGLVLADSRAGQDALAAEGYRLLAKDTSDFAGAAIGIVRETWPAWDSPDSDTEAIGGTCRSEVLSAAQAVTERKGRSTFTPAEIIEEMKARRSSYSAATIRTHITSLMCENAPKNHGTVYNDLRRVKRGVYTLSDTNREAAR